MNPLIVLPPSSILPFDWLSPFGGFSGMTRPPTSKGRSAVDRELVNIVWSWLLPDPQKSLAENVPLRLLWGELESLGWPWLSRLDPYGASWGALGGLGCPFWIPMAPIWSQGVVQEPPGLIRELKEPFQASVGSQCVQTISFYSKICVF